MTDAATLTAQPIIQDEGGRRFGSYLARADAARMPGVVVLHDMFGLNEPIRLVADRFAQRGYAALVPNLFWRSSHPEPMPYDAAQHPAAWERLNAVDLDTVSADIGRAVDWLRSQPYSGGKVGVVGFCGGGRWAYLAAARCKIDAAAALYGLGVSQHLAELGNVRCPLQLHYGQKDEHVPKAEVDAVSAGVQGRAGVEVFLYPEGRHSFANPVRPGYDPAATALAYERIDAMFAAM